MLHDLDLPPGQSGAVWYYSPHQPGTPRHRHRELECNLVLAGRARYLLPWGSCDLEPGTILWLFPGQDHLLIDRDPQFRMWIMVWRPDLVDSLLGPGSGLPDDLRLHDPPGDWFRRIGRGAQVGLDRQCEAVAAAEGRGAAADAGLRWLLVLAWDACRRAELLPADAPAHPAVRQAVFLLAAAEPPRDLPQLAAACGLSPDRLGRLFRRDTGISISDYRNRLRCERACRLLTESDADLTSVALEAGFGSYSHCHRVFQAIYGRSPGSWRKAPD